ncbi:hypothetical protein EDD15DRAFT_2176091, partial [Pisolithus albus]
ILPALSLDGVLHLDIRECAYTPATFNEFINNLLDNMNPFPQKNIRKKGNLLLCTAKLHSL